MILSLATMINTQKISVNSPLGGKTTLISSFLMYLYLIYLIMDYFNLRFLHFTL